jgi:hypothetical protein
MKFQILNNEQIGFYDEVGNLSSIIKPSGSNLIIHPISPDGDIELGQEGIVNDIEVGNLATPSNFTFLGSLPTTDPGVAGRLFQTGSEAIGATAGFQLVLISQG